MAYRIFHLAARDAPHYFKAAKFGLESWEDIYPAGQDNITVIELHGKFIQFLNYASSRPIGYIIEV